MRCIRGRAGGGALMAKLSFPPTWTGGRRQPASALKMNNFGRQQPLYWHFGANVR